MPVRGKVRPKGSGSNKVGTPSKSSSRRQNNFSFLEVCCQVRGFRCCYMHITLIIIFLRYVQIPASKVDTDLLQDAARKENAPK
jgi:hypothetical protein